MSKLHVSIARCIAEVVVSVSNNEPHEEAAGRRESAAPLQLSKRVMQDRTTNCHLNIRRYAHNAMLHCTPFNAAVELPLTQSMWIHQG